MGFWKSLLGNGDAERQRGDELLNAGRYADAVASYDKALKINPKDARAWNNRGVALGKLGHNFEAVESYDKALKINPNYAWAWYNRGNALEKRYYWNDALESYERALKIDSNNAFAWKSRGDVLVHLDLYAGAVESYDRALRIDSKNFNAWKNRGDVLSRLDRYADAVKSYDRALEIDPKDASVWYERGWMLNFLHRYADAVESYGRALEIDPKNFNAWKNRGDIQRMHLDRYADAVESYDRALEIDPKDAYMWCDRGHMLEELERYADAVKSYDRVLEIKPDKAFYWRLRGKALEKLGRYADAVKSYDIALEIDPDEDYNWYSRGNALEKLGRYADAVKSYDIALGTSADVELHSLTLHSRGKALEKLGRYADAVESYDRALEIDPDWAFAWHSRARALVELDRYADAIDSLDRALAIHPDNDDYQRFRAQLVKDDPKPYLSLALSTMALRLGDWQHLEATLHNSGTGDARSIGITLSEEFETRLISTCSVNAGASKEMKITLRPKHGGHVPLDITLTYVDAQDRSYTQTAEFWIDVADQAAGRSTPRSTSPSLVAGFTPQSLAPKQFPPELAERYSEIAFLNKGGFARVYRAKKKDGSDVAVKVPISLDESTGKTFLNEIQNWISLDHENIVKVYDYNIMPVAYFEMEFCDSSLSEVDRPIACDEAAWILFNVCEGLKYAHARSILHRDLKPQNIMLKDGVPKVADWGLSRVMVESRSSTMTSFTPCYASPEQIIGGKKDARTDIWQLGVILYELVCGALPFTGENMVEIGMKIATADPLSPTHLDPETEDLEPIILRCLNKNPDLRYQSIVDLQRNLAGYLNITYAESLKLSILKDDFSRSARYCSELMLINLKIGELGGAYRYATDLSNYVRGDVREGTRQLIDQIRLRLEEGLIEIPGELMEKARIIDHKVRVGHSNM